MAFQEIQILCSGEYASLYSLYTVCDTVYMYKEHTHMTTQIYHIVCGLHSHAHHHHMSTTFFFVPSIETDPVPKHLCISLLYCLHHGE